MSRVRRRLARERIDEAWSEEARAASLRLQGLTREMGSLLDHRDDPGSRRRLDEIHTEKGELLAIVHENWKRRCRS